MHKPDPVSGKQSLSGLQVHAQHFIPGALALLLPGTKGGAFDELHRDEDLAVHLPDFVDLDDVGMGDAGHGLGFAEDAGAAVGAGQLALVQQLDRQLAIELLIVGGVDHSHTALPEVPQDDEPPDAARRLGHGSRRRRRRCQGRRRRLQRRRQGGGVLPGPRPGEGIRGRVLRRSPRVGRISHLHSYITLAGGSRRRPPTPSGAAWAHANRGCERTGSAHRRHSGRGRRTAPCA